jgi:hypothetical protein
VWLKSAGKWFIGLETGKRAIIVQPEAWIHPFPAPT